MKHVVLGAGPVGLAACAALGRLGVTVQLVSRRAPRALPEGVTHHALNVRDAAALAHVCEGSDVVYQCLGAPYHRWREELPALQAAAVAAAQRSGARLVSFENLYVYGKPRLAPFTETDELAPCSAKGEVRAEMARELRTLHDSGRLVVAQVRASDLFGPGMRQSALGEQLLGRAVSGKSPRLLGNPQMPHTWTYVADAANTLARVGTRHDTFGRVWHVPSAPPLSQAAIVARLGALLGKHLVSSATPKLALRLFGIFRPEAGEILEMLYEFERPFVMSDAAARTRLGQTHTPFDEALRETVRAWWSN